MQDRYVQRRTDVRLELLPDGSGLLYDPRGRIAYAISVSGVMVWEHCDGRHRTADLCELLLACYDAPPEVIVADVTAFVNHIAQLGLLDSTPVPVM